MANLNMGSTGPAVRDLQNQPAVREFQGRRGLKVDGIVGPLTRAALASPAPTPPNGQTFNYTVPGVEHIAQDKTMSCWFASAQMLIQWQRRRTQSTQDGHPDPSESEKWSKLYSDNTGISNGKIKEFARDMGFTVVPPMSPTPEAILGWLIAHGPLWVNGVKHITVIAGIRGESNDPDVLVYDPARPPFSPPEW
ncbi:MAG: peptidoglycan-binding protein, partial [Rhizobiales bacterium]|nr:peptidoglycan-binding protein [Hyphomicrobiales bacterium]